MGSRRGFWYALGALAERDDYVLSLLIRARLRAKVASYLLDRSPGSQCCSALDATRSSLVRRVSHALLC